VKAIRTHGRGGPEQLFFEDAPMPVVRPGDVLVRVRATGITPAELTWDETYRNADGTPRIPSIPGHEPSGLVEQPAPDVADFRAGDEVYGLADFPRDGAAAEFAAVRAANLALKPRSIPHVQAAALPLSALTAWQALFEHASRCRAVRADPRRRRRRGNAGSATGALARSPRSSHGIRARHGAGAQSGC